MKVCGLVKSIELHFNLSWKLHRVLSNYTLACFSFYRNISSKSRRKYCASQVLAVLTFDEKRLGPSIIRRLPRSSLTLFIVPDEHPITIFVIWFFFQKGTVFFSYVKSIFPFSPRLYKYILLEHTCRMTLKNRIDLCSVFFAINQLNLHRPLIELSSRTFQQH